MNLTERTGSARCRIEGLQKNMLLALGCFLVIVVLNFFLPRLLPGDPVAYLTGFAEEDMTPAQIDYYRQALHLDKPLIVQFGYYLRSLADGTLGYSYKKKRRRRAAHPRTPRLYASDHHPRRPAFGGAGAFVGTCLRLPEKQHRRPALHRLAHRPECRSDLCDRSGAHACILLSKLPSPPTPVSARPAS